MTTSKTISNVTVKFQTKLLVDSYQMFTEFKNERTSGSQFSEGVKYAFELAAERMLHVCKMCGIEILPLAITPEMEKEAANVE